MKVVYAENAEHEYLHVIDIDNGFIKGGAYIVSDGADKGCLAVKDSMMGDFKPDMWNFLDDDRATGTYHRDDITEKLLANVSLAGVN
jgi:hypothetical protein